MRSLYDSAERELRGSETVAGTHELSARGLPGEPPASRTPRVVEMILAPQGAVSHGGACVIRSAARQVCGMPRSVDSLIDTHPMAEELTGGLVMRAQELCGSPG